MNTIVVIEDQATQQQHQREPYPSGSAMDVLCLVRRSDSSDCRRVVPKMRRESAASPAN